MNEEKKTQPNEEKKAQLTVPYIVYESAQTRAERTIKRQNIIIAVISIIAIVSVFLTAYFVDKGWREYFSECDITSYDYSQDGTGVNIVGDRNGVDYNGSESENKEN